MSRSARWNPTSTCVILLMGTASLPWLANLWAPDHSPAVPHVARASSLQVRGGDRLTGQWKVKVIPDADAHKAGKKDFDDTLIFKGNTFESEACRPHGFKPVEYEADTRGVSTVPFSAKPKSEKEGTAHWQGVVTGNDIKGELEWTKPDGSVLRYTFQGEKK
ncbi:MAG: hypothetical protein ACREIT_07385 [Tepidisphaeraceae bacterium]